MVMMFVGGLCCCLTDYSYYSYCRKSTGQELFVPARTHSGKAVNSLTPECVPPGTKTSHSEDFLLAKHTSHKPIFPSSGMVSMDEHTPPPGASLEGVGRGRHRRV